VNKTCSDLQRDEVKHRRHCTADVYGRTDVEDRAVFERVRLGPIDRRPESVAGGRKVR